MLSLQSGTEWTDSIERAGDGGVGGPEIASYESQDEVGDFGEGRE